MRGGGSAMGAGSGFLQSLADDTGGSLGATLHTLSGLTNPRVGYAIPGTSPGVDFRISGSMGNRMGKPAGAGGRGQGGGPGVSLKLKF